MPLPETDQRSRLDGLRFRAERAWDDDARVADDTVERVLVLGDIHNDERILAAALTAAALEECDALVQVGDFWLQDASWERYDPERAEVYRQLGLNVVNPTTILDEMVREAAFGQPNHEAPGNEGSNH